MPRLVIGRVHDAEHREHYVAERSADGSAARSPRAMDVLSRLPGALLGHRQQRRLRVDADCMRAELGRDRAALPVLVATSSTRSPAFTPAS